MDKPRESLLHQYYVAVGCYESKLSTLLDLLQAISEYSLDDVPVAICCSSRDSCDEALSMLAKGTEFQLACLHGDLVEAELVSASAAFGRATQVASEQRAAEQLQPPPVDDPFVHPDDLRTSQVAAELQAAHSKSKCTTRVLVCTDAAVKALPQESLPVGARLVINLDLPVSKECHHLRISSILGMAPDTGAKRAIIHFVVAGQVTQFRRLEKFSNAAIHEMPIHASDILL